VTEHELAAHHYGVTVADLDSAVAFYGETFGLDVLDRFTVSGEAFATAVDVADATGRFAHLDADGTRLELVEYDPEGDATSAATVNRPGATHLGLSVADLDRFYEGLADDVETLSEPRTTDSGTRILFVRDPEGNLVEVLEA
jgi:catechol 2,3-dioxygenase-like lactoylglutathione lyase family enzyme